MADNLITSVRREIDRLQKEIRQRTSQVASLKGELKRHQRVYQLLGGGNRRTRRPGRVRGSARRAAPVNWNSVLEKLPGRFTVADIARSERTKGKSPAYIRQIAIRWLKERKTKRIRRGRYQRIGGPEPRQTPKKSPAKRSKWA